MEEEFEYKEGEMFRQIFVITYAWLILMLSRLVSMAYSPIFRLGAWYGLRKANRDLTPLLTEMGASEDEIVHTVRAMSEVFALDVIAKIKIWLVVETDWFSVEPSTDLTAAELNRFFGYLIRDFKAIFSGEIVPLRKESRTRKEFREKLHKLINDRAAISVQPVEVES